MSWERTGTESHLRAPGYQSVVWLDPRTKRWDYFLWATSCMGKVTLCDGKGMDTRGQAIERCNRALREHKRAPSTGVTMQIERKP